MVHWAITPQSGVPDWSQGICWTITPLKWSKNGGLAKWGRGAMGVESSPPLSLPRRFPNQLELEALERFSRGLQGLTELVLEEVQTLKAQARDFQKDLGADCAFAWSLASNVNHMFIYYEEKRVRSMQAQLSKLKLEFRRALFQGRHDLEVELSVKLNRLTADIVAGHIKASLSSPQPPSSSSPTLFSESLQRPS
eukprot:CAMPEP_0113680438 /NCGR_PEP_ID=MMETSP0038_2-20120614/11316_1 /TAXON_ID=2898 /ORGANISM="Cryptomonas paramecium" /LENGTH=194 /DNA_ID=CAMNT_0000598813 /DNA_START=377 /DNA_END=965 /DNA_ORIENTATION=- /assembly_acc=CAM_ASM_000170